MSTESGSFSVAWSASVEFRCRLGGQESAWQLAAREVASQLEFQNLVPDSTYAARA